MAIKVTVNTQKSVVSSVKQKKTVVSSVNVSPKPDLSLGQLKNVDASDPDEGETVVYDATTNKYVVKPIIVTSNNITNIAGGTF